MQVQPSLAAASVAVAQVQCITHSPNHRVDFWFSLQQIAMASAWSESAEIYSRNFQRGKENEISLDMSVGRQAVVAKVVNALADKVVQGPSEVISVPE